MITRTVVCTLQCLCAAFVATAAITAVAVGGGTTHVVELHEMTFQPDELTIQVGDTVRWVWVAEFHNVESGVNGNHDGNFISGAPTFPPAAFLLTFDQDFLDENPMPDNVYPYYCIVHVGFGMSGTITVEVPQEPCAGDLNGDEVVNVSDLLLQLGAFGACPGGCEADLNGDEVVNVSDLLLLLGNFGACP